MSSAGDPTVPVNIFNEDEDLLDDDDEEDSEDDSISPSAVPAVDFLTPSPSPMAPKVTIAVPSIPDLHLKQQNMEIVVAKKPPAQLDESRKLFQRLWTDEDEIELLQGFLDYTTQRGANQNSSHHHDTTAFYDQIKSKFQLDFNKNQLVEKLRRLKKKYRNVINKFGTGKEYAFKSPHDHATFQISAQIWGNTVAAVNVNNGYSPAPFRAVPLEDDDEETNNVGYQSPNVNGIDANKPRPRKRNRGGTVKIEDKQHQQAVNSNNVNYSQPSVAATPIATPVMAMGMTGSISSVIEETVKSCLSPIFKELLGNSTSSNNQNSNGMFNGHGIGIGSLALSPMPLGFIGSISGDKVNDGRWRKQQILELEVFAKRLELVQEQISEQLQELRSIEN